MSIEKFKCSQDYKDICYMIEHVVDISPRLDVLAKLGYKLGVMIVKNDNNYKKVIMSKNKKDIRIQVTPKYKSINCANCVIIDTSKK